MLLHKQLKSKHRLLKGSYVRIALRDIPPKALANFKSQPIILSYLSPQEAQTGFLLLKLKKHRFYRNQMKTHDPLILSLNFSKFQTVPYFCRRDFGERLRMLKYSPKHEFCFAVVYGTYAPPNTGIAAFQSIHDHLDKFRVAMTGSVVGFAQNYDIKKKLKLVGEPFKIFKNSAFIKNMFSSDLELHKFIGAQIKTVSGIRGQIKAAVAKQGPPGSFRAAFEDKILMSDIVFCRTWYSIKLSRFCNPISNIFF